ncbi:beta-eliminating lyase family protein, partial [Vibrio parahaemolyticus V-223/04]
LNVCAKYVAVKRRCSSRTITLIPRRGILSSTAVRLSTL